MTITTGAILASYRGARHAFYGIGLFSALIIVPARMPRRTMRT